jgi:hypothetical protein
MNGTTVAVDLAKSALQLIVTDWRWKIIATRCRSRTQFERWFVNRGVGLVVVDASATLPCAMVWAMARRRHR